MRLVFLGTNGWYDNHLGNTVCILIETTRAIILLDAGSGLYKADRYLSPGKPVHLFVSHLHLDHVIGLHQLNKFTIPEGLTIHCGRGVRAGLETLIAPPYSLPFSSLPYSVDIREFASDSLAIDGFSARVAPMMHSVPTIGFRFSLEGRSIAYCPDTGYCENALDLASDVDLLIAECAYRPGEESLSWPHLNPQHAAMLAREAGAKQLVLVHFDAFRYPDMESRLAAETVAKGIFAASSIAVDGQCMSV